TRAAHPNLVQRVRIPATDSEAFNFVPHLGHVTGIGMRHTGLGAWGFIRRFGSAKYQVDCP
ncbi:MAG TPA: hypothetical protein VG122_15650, partial [Gemmata sp.]|nr:hypothetical protein [Gemmata sp.]